MLIKYSAENYRNHKDKTEISFLAGSRKGLSAAFQVDSDLIVTNTAVAITGGYSSGKSNYLRSLSFLAYFACNSKSNTAPLPVVSSIESESKVTTLEALLYINSTMYHYSASFLGGLVVKEFLEKKTGRQFSRVFSREWEGSEAKGSWNTSGVFKSYVFNVMDRTSSAISWASALCVSEVEDVFNFFLNMKSTYEINNAISYGKKIVHTHTRSSENLKDLMASAKFFYENEGHRASLGQAFKHLDFGFSRVDIEPIEYQKDMFKVRCVRESADEDGQEFSLQLASESSGTKDLFVLFRDILHVIKDGGLAIIDGLDEKLHPHLLKEIVSLFKSKRCHHSAQILFVCKNGIIFDALKCDQVYISDKTGHAATLTRVDKMSQRIDADYELLYNRGVLGGFPKSLSKPKIS